MTPQNTVYANSNLIAVNGSKGSGHASSNPSDPRHQQYVWQTQSSGTQVFINNLPVSLQGDTDSCGHVRVGGSPNIFIGSKGNTSMACSSPNATYITPEGVSTMYTPAARATLGQESVGQADAPPPANAIMKDDAPAPDLPPADPVSCGEFNEQTPDSVQLSTNYRLSDVSSQTAYSHYTVTAQLGLSRAQIICNLKQMCETIAEAVRSHVISLGHPRLTITSGFRIGSDGSHHNRGAALDMQVLTMKPSEIFALAQWVRDTLPCDQIILEGVGAANHWIHASMPLQGTVSVAASARALTQVAQRSYSNGLSLLNYGGANQ